MRLFLRCFSLGCSTYLKLAHVTNVMHTGQENAHDEGDCIPDTLWLELHRFVTVVYLL